jgi:acyl-CoA thioester hydrolase
VERQIFYHDTDAGGVVYYGNYLKYLEEARTEFLKEKGLDINKLRERNFLYAVRKCNITYKSPARYGDIITATAELKKTTAAQLIFDQKVLNKETGQILVIAEVSLVCLTPDFKPTTIPDFLKL